MSSATAVVTLGLHASVKQGGGFSKSQLSIGITISAPHFQNEGDHRVAEGEKQFMAEAKNRSRMKDAEVFDKTRNGKTRNLISIK